jgi:hypothetical protein
MDCCNTCRNDNSLNSVFVASINMKTNYRSNAFSAIHGSANALHKVGAIDKATMRDFDEASLSIKRPSFQPSVALAEREVEPRFISMGYVTLP